MKNILTLILLLAFSALSAQVDTTYASIRKGVNPLSGDSTYYETTYTVYVDGRMNSVETRLGDTTQVIEKLFDVVKTRARRFSDFANEVWKKDDEYIEPILQKNGILTILFDTSIIQISVDLYGPAVDSTTWDIESTSGNFTGELTIAPNGNNLRMRIGGTNYSLLPVGDAWIRFQNFPPGEFTDLHRKQGPGKLEFRSVDQSLIIRRQ